jgi:hypothetical protein
LLFIPLSLLLSSTSLKKLLFAMGFAVTVTGLGQYLIFPDIRALAAAEWDPHYYRVVGTLLDPGFIGAVLCGFLLLLIYFRDKFTRLKFWTMTTVVYLSFALTYSRSSYLAFIAGMLVYSILKKSARPVIVSALVLSATLLALPRSPDGEGVKLERTSSIRARIINWQHSISIFAQNPVLGTGFNTYRYAQKQAGFLDDDKWIKSHSGAGADSSLLFVAATTGIVGLFFYLGFVRQLWGTSDDFFPVLTSAILVHSLFLNTLFYPHYLFFLGTVLALFRPVRVEK